MNGFAITVTWGGNSAIVNRPGFVGGSTFSGVGASDKPGAVQTEAREAPKLVHRA